MQANGRTLPSVRRKCTQSRHTDSKRGAACAVRYSHPCALYTGGVLVNVGGVLHPFPCFPVCAAVASVWRLVRAARTG